MIQQYGIEAHSSLWAEHGDRSFTIVGKNGPPARPRSQSGDQSALSWLIVDQHQQGRAVMRHEYTLHSDRDPDIKDASKDLINSTRDSLPSLGLRGWAIVIK